MLSDLPEPNRAPLPGSPLELVVWQLQLAEPLEIGDPKVGTGLQAALSDEAGQFGLARLAPPALTVAVTQGSVPAGQPSAVEPFPPEEGWRLQRDGLVVTLNNQALTLESSAYTDWDDFRPIFERSLQALANLVELSGEQRLGLRFVDKVVRSDVERPSDWTPWIESWLLGPLQHPTLADSVQGLAQQIDFDAGEGLRLTLRSRVFPDPERRGRSSCLLDFDAFREGYRLYDLQGVLETSDALNTLSLQVFQTSITSDLYNAFAGTLPSG